MPTASSSFGLHLPNLVWVLTKANNSVVLTPRIVNPINYYSQKGRCRPNLVDAVGIFVAGLPSEIKCVYLGLLAHFHWVLALQHDRIQTLPKSGTQGKIKVFP